MTAASLPTSPASSAAIGFFHATAPLTRVRWYFAPPGAKPLPGGTIFAGDDHDNEVERCEVLYGELPFAPDRRWNRGDPPPGVTGQSFCGSSADFLLPHQPKSCCELTVACTCCTIVCCNPFCGGLIGFCLGPTLPAGLIELVGDSFDVGMVDLVGGAGDTGVIELVGLGFTGDVGLIELVGFSGDAGLIELLNPMPEEPYIELVGDSFDVGMIELVGRSADLGQIELVGFSGDAGLVELVGFSEDAGLIELIGDSGTVATMTVALFWVGEDTLIFQASAVVTPDDPSMGGGSASGPSTLLVGLTAVVTPDDPSMGGGSASGPSTLVFGLVATVVTT